MAGDPDVFSVDPDELDQVVGDLERTETALEELTADVERNMRALHEVWEGLSAQAQAEAQAEWEQGLATMRAALAALRAAARTAHGNYTAAAQTNLAMWERVR